MNSDGTHYRRFCLCNFSPLGIRNSTVSLSEIFQIRLHHFPYNGGPCFGIVWHNKWNHKNLFCTYLMREQKQRFLNTKVQAPIEFFFFTLNTLVNVNMVNFQARKRIIIFNSFAKPKVLFRDKKNTTFRPNIRSNSINALMLTSHT